MALSSALFSGISGLSSLGNAMQIIGDNIANVNTVGFKGSSFTFQDLLSQSVGTQSGSSQVGRGTALGDVAASFEQGSFESTGSTTDLAIGGEGFFVLKEANSDNLFYTRAGNFRFDRNGYLTNPAGLVVQGWRLDENGDDVGSVTDIVLNSFTSPPAESRQLTLVTNLDSDAAAHSAGALVASWDAATGSVGENSYDYQSTVKVYDSLGSTHDINLYFAKTDSSQWEYVITCNPDEDSRSGATGAGAGLLARGNITFSDSSGTITDLTMDTSDGAGAWTPVTPNTDGYLEFSPDFLGGTSPPTVMGIALNLGSHFDGTSWLNDSLTTSQ
ncbi:MAG: flagellar hook-basal body complex protein [Deltaproteobacteria bacterium]